MGFDIANFAVPVWIFLVFYGVFLVFFIVYSLFNLYHLLRFGTFGIGLFAVIAIFLFGTAMLLAGSFVTLASYDWTATATISDYLENDASYLGF